MWGHRASIPQNALIRASVIEFFSHLRGELILESWGGAGGKEGAGNKDTLVFGFERVRERDQFVEKFRARKAAEGDIKVVVHDDINGDLPTPPKLARAIVGHFKPQGKILEPCAGAGAFLDCLPGAEWCEIKKDRDFFQYYGKVDWIIGNPPYMRRLEFLERSLQLAADTVLLFQVPMMFFKSRLEIVSRYGCGIREIVLIDNPPEPWPQFGMELGAVHIQKGHKGGITVTDKRGAFPVDFG